MFGFTKKENDDEHSSKKKKKSSGKSKKKTNEEVVPKSNNSKKKKTTSPTKKKKENNQLVVQDNGGRTLTRFNLFALVRTNKNKNNERDKKRQNQEKAGSDNDGELMTNRKVQNKKKQQAVRSHMGARDSMVTIGGGNGTSLLSPKRLPFSFDETNNSSAVDDDNNDNNSGGSDSVDNNDRHHTKYQTSPTKKKQRDRHKNDNDEYDTNSTSSDSNKRGTSNSNNQGYVVDTLLNFGGNNNSLNNSNNKAGGHTKSQSPTKSSLNHSSHHQSPSKAHTNSVGVRFTVNSKNPSSDGFSNDSLVDSNARSNSTHSKSNSNNNNTYNNTNNNNNNNKSLSTKEQMINKKKMKSLIKKRISLMNDQWFYFLCHNTIFCKLCDTVFDMVDIDESGAVDENELYNGLLLIHLKLGIYFGSAACIRPISREQCIILFHKLDRDKMGIVDKIDFREIMILLFGNVLLRVIIQWTITIMIVPFIAQYFLRSFKLILYYPISIIMKIISPIFILFFGSNRIIEDNPTIDAISIAQSIAYNNINITSMTNETMLVLSNNVLGDVINTSAAAVAVGTTTTTANSSKVAIYWMVLRFIINSIQYVISLIPQKVYKTAPLVIVSTLLGMGIVPIFIYYIDTFFHSYADSRAKKPRSSKY